MAFVGSLAHFCGSVLFIYFVLGRAILFLLQETTFIKFSRSLQVHRGLVNECVAHTQKGLA